MSTDASNSKATELSLKPDAARGRSLFRQSCAGCHGSDGNNVNGFDLRSIKNHMTAEQIVSWLENPAPPMPRVFPAPLDADDRRDMRDIAEYLLDGLQ
jgi:mono/diheme cytochrome c family protein